MRIGPLLFCPTCTELGDAWCPPFALFHLKTVAKAQRESCANALNGEGSAAPRCALGGPWTGFVKDMLAVCNAGRSGVTWVEVRV